MEVKNWNEVFPIASQIYNYFLLLLKLCRCYSEFRPSIIICFSHSVAEFIFLPHRLLYSGVSVEVNQSYILLISNLLLIVVPFWNIFQFRNRKRQFVLNRVLLLFTLGILFNQSIGYFNAKTNEINQLLVFVVTMFTIIFLSLANKAIKHDEDLIQSADRLR